MLRSANHSLLGLVLLSLDIHVKTEAIIIWSRSLLCSYSATKPRSRWSLSLDLGPHRLLSLLWLCFLSELCQLGRVLLSSLGRENWSRQCHRMRIVIVVDGGLGLALITVSVRREYPLFLRLSCWGSVRPSWGSRRWSELHYFYLIYFWINYLNKLFFLNLN